ncbi:MAG: cell division protein ZapE [Porticoccaceae bacterium]
MPLTPLQRYQQDLQRGDFSADPAQAVAVQKLQALLDQLVVAPAPEVGLFTRLFRQRSQLAVRGVRGLYFWGGVGRGKTYLMDNFYEALPFRQKMRTHFHRFMRRVHRDMKLLAGHKNPLDHVAAGIAKDVRVICFDEFFVSDITDAMILATLMEQLFARGVTLVATSNIIPDELYKDGLQRQRFLPAIELIKQHCEIVNVDGGVDYRLRALTQADLYHSPLGEVAEAALARIFRALIAVSDEARQGASLEVEGRYIPSRWLAEDVVWFDFSALCDGPRSQNDYIEIAREFHAVLISSVPILGVGRDDQARRFINLVDEFYDRGVKLALSTAVPVAELYREGRLAFEFQRTCSRLLEMQSHEYLARAHRP